MSVAYYWSSEQFILPLSAGLVWSRDELWDTLSSEAVLWKVVLCVGVFLMWGTDLLPGVAWSGTDPDRYRSESLCWATSWTPQEYGFSCFCNKTKTHTHQNEFIYAAVSWKRHINGFYLLLLFKKCLYSVSGCKNQISERDWTRISQQHSFWFYLRTVDINRLRQILSNVFIVTSWLSSLLCGALLKGSEFLQFPERKKIWFNMFRLIHRQYSDISCVTTLIQLKSDFYSLWWIL